MVPLGNWYSYENNKTYADTYPIHPHTVHGSGIFTFNFGLNHLKSMMVNVGKYVSPSYFPHSFTFWSSLSSSASTWIFHRSVASFDAYIRRETSRTSLEPKHGGWFSNHTIGGPSFFSHCHQFHPDSNIYLISDFVRYSSKSCRILREKYPPKHYTYHRTCVCDCVSAGQTSHSPSLVEGWLDSSRLPYVFVNWMLYHEGIWPNLNPTIQFLVTADQSGVVCEQWRQKYRPSILILHLWRALLTQIQRSNCDYFSLDQVHFLVTVTYCTWEMNFKLETINIGRPHLVMIVSEILENSGQNTAHKCMIDPWFPGWHYQATSVW